MSLESLIEEVVDSVMMMMNDDDAMWLWWFEISEATFSFP